MLGPHTGPCPSRAIGQKSPLGFSTKSLGTSNGCTAAGVWGQRDPAGDFPFAYSLETVVPVASCEWPRTMPDTRIISRLRRKMISTTCSSPPSMNNSSAGTLSKVFHSRYGNTRHGAWPSSKRSHRWCTHHHGRFHGCEDLIKIRASGSAVPLHRIFSICWFQRKWRRRYADRPESSLRFVGRRAFPSNGSAEK